MSTLLTIILPSAVITKGSVNSAYVLATKCFPLSKSIHLLQISKYVL